MGEQSLASLNEIPGHTPVKRYPLTLVAPISGSKSKCSNIAPE